MATAYSPSISVCSPSTSTYSPSIRRQSSARSERIQFKEDLSMRSKDHDQALAQALQDLRELMVYTTQDFRDVCLAADRRLLDGKDITSLSKFDKKFLKDKLGLLLGFQKDAWDVLELALLNKNQQVMYDKPLKYKKQLDDKFFQFSEKCRLAPSAIGPSVAIVIVRLEDILDTIRDTPIENLVVRINNDISDADQNLANIIRKNTITDKDSVNTMKRQLSSFKTKSKKEQVLVEAKLDESIHEVSKNIATEKRRSTQISIAPLVSEPDGSKKTKKGKRKIPGIFRRLRKLFKGKRKTRK